MKWLVFVLIFLCESVVAVSGVMPGSYEINFEPGYSGKFVFDFVLSGGADLYTEGELAKYVELDKEKVFGREKVVAFLNLPSVIDKPGVSQIFIGARGGDEDVRGVIKVAVPYPDEYIGLELSAPNVNVGDVVNINLRMFNFGKRDTDVIPSVEIYKGEERVKVFYGRGERINVLRISDFNVSFNSSDYSSGDYIAVALVNYGDKSSRAENLFRIGEFFVRILNYSDEFIEGKVGRFEVGVESLWNSKMEEVYAEVRIVGSDVEFDSSIVKLYGWEKKVLVGAFDASGFSAGDVDAKIILHYDGGVISEDVNFEIIRRIDCFFYGCVFGFLVFLAGLIWFLFFRKRKVND